MSYSTGDEIMQQMAIWRSVLAEIISFTQAKSLAGALVQMALAADELETFVSQVSDGETVSDGARCIERLIGSAARAVRDAFAIIAEADKIDPEFGLYLRLLIYTSIRKDEGLKLFSGDVHPEERAAWLRTSKNEDPRMLKLREDILEPLTKHLETNSGERLFRFNDGGHFKHLLMRAKMAVLGLPCPKRRPIGWKPPENRLAFVGFHTFRHAWATWMRRYGGAVVQRLVGTGNWRDPRSAARYSHVVSRDEWDRVANLPNMGIGRGKADVA